MNVSRKRLVTDLSTLVQIPSWQECETIGRHVLAELRKMGLSGAHRDKAGNIIATLGSGGPGLMLNAHLDTVPPGDYQGDPFSGKVTGGRLLGRGASDDKAGVAAMLEIARLLKDRTLNQQVTFAFTVWEESTSYGPNGAYQVAKDCKAARAIILESTMSSSGKSMGVDIGCKGIMNLYVTVKGKAYHSAKPERGENALYRAAQVIAAFEKAFDPATMPRRTYRVWKKDVELGVLATMTEIEARQGTNVIPGACQIVANCRLLPDGDESEILRRMKRLTASLPKGWIAWHTGRRILGHLCDDHGLIAACRQAISETGLRPTCDILHGRTDTTIFHHTGGIQSVIMGPGTSGTAHTKNEFVTVDNLTSGTRAVLRVVENLACR